MIVIENESGNNVVLGIDNWSDSTTKLIENELGLSPEEVNKDEIKYTISDSDTFSRIYSKISRSTEFSYIDNESYFDNMTFSLVYGIPGGKVSLSANLKYNAFELIASRTSNELIR